MIGSPQLSRIVLVCLTCVASATAQDTESHRSLKRPGMDTRGIQLRLELLQRLQQIAKLRRENGQPPLDLKKLSNEVREKLDQVQKQDKRIREGLENAQQKRENTNPGSPQNLAKDIDKTIEDIDRLKRENDTEPRKPDNDNGIPSTQDRGKRNQDRGTDVEDARRTIERLEKQVELEQAGRKAESMKRELQGQPDNPRRQRRLRKELDELRRTLPDSANKANEPSAADQARELFDKFKRKSQQRDPGRYGAPEPQDPQSGRRSNNNGSDAQNTDSQRQLEPGDFDGFDIEKYLKRLENMAPRSSSGQRTPQGSRKSNGRQTGNNGRSSSGRQSPRSPSGTGKSPGNKTGTSKRPSKKDFTKLWKNAEKGLAGTNRRNKETGELETNPAAPPANPNNDGNNSTGGSKPGTDPGKGFFSGAMKRTAESMFDEIGKAVRKNGRNGRGNQNTQRNSNQPSGGGFMDSVRQAGKKTGDFLGGASKPVENIADSVSGGGGVSMPSGPDLSSIAPFLLIAVLVIAAWFGLKYFESSQPEPALVSNVPTELPATVSTRQDVIDAFHYIASQTPSVKGNWWTHSRVAKALRRLWPTQTDAISELKQVYETARYLPPDAELSPEQVQAARVAIERCSA